MFETGYAIRNMIDREAVVRVRNGFGMTQRQFAAFLGCSKPTVERMEKGEEPLTGPVAMLLNIMEQQPEVFEYYKVPEKMAPLRMWYMFRDKPCTLIDVDLQRQKVWIRNYVDHLQFRAFGKKEKPTYEDFENFLRSRCFPETRDKMKLQLREMDVPFYDPMLIIDRTQGRMEEDEFWIKVEEE